MSKNAKSGSLLQRAVKKWDRQWTDYKMARRKAGYRRKAGPPARKVAAFVVGCQRSGTDMTIKTLDRSLDVDRFDEYDAAAFDDCRIRDKTVRDGLIAASTAKCIVFKPVCDSHLVTQLLGDHPGGKVIWVYRSYQDVANSAVERWKEKTREWLEEVLKGGGDWGVRQWNIEKITEQCLAEVREACSGGFCDHGAASVFWYMRNLTFYEQGLESNPDVLLVRYEQVVSEPQEQFARMCRFLDIGFDADMVDKVFRSSVRKREFPAISEPIRTLCEAMQDRLDQSLRSGQSGGGVTAS